MAPLAGTSVPADCISEIAALFNIYHDHPDLSAQTRRVALGSSCHLSSVPIGGLKVTMANDWFAARPSGTEDIYNLYAVSFDSADYLRLIVKETQNIVTDAFISQRGMSCFFNP